MFGCGVLVYILETVMSRKLTLGRNIGWGVCVHYHGATLV